MANVPSFRFSFWGNIRQNHPFGNHPFANPRSFVKRGKLFLYLQFWDPAGLAWHGKRPKAGNGKKTWKSKWNPAPSWTGAKMAKTRILDGVFHYFSIFLATKKNHRVLQGAAQSGAQYYLTFVVLQALFCMQQNEPFLP